MNRIRKGEYNNWSFVLLGNQAEKLYKICKGTSHSFLLQFASSDYNCSSPPAQRISSKQEASFGVHVTGLCIISFHIFIPYTILSFQSNFWLLL